MGESKPKKQGRPSKYTTKLAEEFLARISAGEKITHICKDKHMPSAVTIYAWERRDEEFLKSFARARDKACDAISYEAMEIADNPEIEPAHKRVMVDTRLKLLGMWSNRYASKQAVAHTAPEGRIAGEPLTRDELMAIARGGKD